MGAVRTHKQKNERNAPIRFPSFVYRQDGYELSYEVAEIVPQAPGFVKCHQLTCPLPAWYNNEKEVGRMKLVTLGKQDTSEVLALFCRC